MPRMISSGRKANNISSENNRSNSANPKFRQIVKRSIVNASAFETIHLKERQKKELKDFRRAKITPVHEAVLEYVAVYLGFDISAIIDFIIDSEEQISLLVNFCKCHGSKLLLLFYQEVEDKLNQARTSFMASKKKSANKKLFITLPQNPVALSGEALFVFRKSVDLELNLTNISEQTTFGVIDASKGLLAGISSLISTVMQPALQASKTWVINVKGSQINGGATQQHLMDDINSFLLYLRSTQTSVDNVVYLKESSTLNLDLCQTAADCAHIAACSDQLVNVEKLVLTWCKQLETLLGASLRMRKEADTTGPLAELEHWRNLTASFNAVLSQVKGHDSKMAVSILRMAKSKVLKKWQELESKVMQAATEAKDNVKYLYTIERFFYPMYKGDPVAIDKSIPFLVNAVNMIQGTSRFYNTSERMTSFFMKVTNQAVLSCKSYITNHGSATVWEQNRKVVMEKLKTCNTLNQDYKISLQRVKQKNIEIRGTEQCFSERNIFGKLDAFYKRLEKIKILLETIDQFSPMMVSHIEGLGDSSDCLQALIKNITQATYDPLDYKKQEFEDDFENFETGIDSLKRDIKKHINETVQQIRNCKGALKRLKLFEQLKLPGVMFDDNYGYVLHLFGEELARTLKEYRKYKDDVPVARDMPPVAGKISWARLMYRNIRETMDILATHTMLMTSDEGKSVIKKFNKTASDLLEFELTCHRTWATSLEAISDALRKPVFKICDETGEIVVNFDTYLNEAMRETDIMLKMGLDIPHAAKFLHYKQDALKENHHKIELLLSKFEAIICTVPSIFFEIIQEYVEQMNSVLRSGILDLTWVSVDLPQFITNIDYQINEFEQFVEQVKGIKAHQIDDVIEEVSNWALYNLPENGTWTVEQVIHNATEHCVYSSKILDGKSRQIEEAVSRLIGLFAEQCGIRDIQGYDWLVNTNINDLDPKHLVLWEGSYRVYVIVNQKLTNALTRAVKTSLDILRKRITFASLLRAPKEDVEFLSLPVFTVDIVIENANLAISPTMKDIQQTVANLSKIIADTCKGIALWGQERFSFLSETTYNTNQATPSVISICHEISPETLKNYFKIVIEQKDVHKIYLMLGSSVTRFNESISKALEEFTKYQHLWCDDRELAMKEFLNTGPVYGDFKQRIIEYDDLLTEIESLPQEIIVGPISLHTTKLKKIMEGEIRDWQAAYYTHLYKEYRPVAEEITQFIDEKVKYFMRPIRTLDEVQGAMVALEEIRQREVNVDLMLRPLEETYAILTTYGMKLTSEEINQVDSLRYNFSKLKAVAASIQNKLCSIQTSLQTKLVESIERFTERVNTFVDDYHENGPLAEGVTPQQGGDMLNVFQNGFDELYQIYEKNVAGEQLFGLPVTPYPEFKKMKKELSLLRQLHKFYDRATAVMNKYAEIPWTETDIQLVTKEVLQLKTTCDNQHQLVTEWNTYLHLKKEIDLFFENCPVLQLIVSSNLMSRHWDRISTICDSQQDINLDTFCLRDILTLNLVDYKEHVEEICISASKEQDIEDKLKSITDFWLNQTLRFASFKQRGEIILKAAETSELIANLEDSVVNLGSLMNNRYNVPFRKQIQECSNNLSTALDIIEDWIHVQTSWIYLEEIFSNRDIAKKLPQETKRFKGVDTSWVKIMQRAHEVRSVITCCVFDDTVAELLPHMLEQLEICQKSLNSYLEAKRMIFPRFFFISDPVLLEILGHASEPKTIEQHIGSLFTNVSFIMFKDNNTSGRITDIVSREGEALPITSGCVSARGNVEIWLGDLLMNQRKSLHKLIAETYYDLTVDNVTEVYECIQENLTQVGTIVLQLIWTRRTEEAIDQSRHDRRILNSTCRKFGEMLHYLIETMSHEIPQLQRKKLESIITIHIHQRDISEEIAKLEVRSVSDFEWQKRRRFYFKEDTNNCLMGITDAYFVYQDEFLGCLDRLVITPLTDRCYITIAQALKMFLGAAPEGPAGTGKTETVKDIGKSAGTYVVIFNCSNQMEFRGLGKIFKGAAMSGSWVCFDEFNRIKVEVLSAAAGQVYSIFSALKERKCEFEFIDGNMLPLNHRCGIFTTMNPGYVGRYVLPQNLKEQFRTTAMMVPDRQIIIRVKLASCGYLENEHLAQKFDTLYKVCEEQLSKQIHYDFGLRNVLSVLRTLASKKIAFPDKIESEIVFETLRTINLSKMTDDDEPLFLLLLDNLFPEHRHDSQSYPLLSSAIAKNVEESNLINHKPWHMKIIQLYETSNVRHGIMILGPSGSGKSCCIETLAKSLSDIGQPHKNIRMNPKSISTCQLFGYLDVITNDWSDGVFSTVWRRCLKLKKPNHTWWITIDGPVDSTWIENLNSVLDDNKRLTLANGDRLPMDPNSKVLFEVQNIGNASPATVSRCGMVYMGSTVLDWKPILKGWLKTRNQREVSVFSDLFEKVFGEMYDYVTHYLHTKMPVMQCNYIVQACNLLQGLIPQYRYYQIRTKLHLEKLFTFSLMWSLGALLDHDDRAKLQECMETFRDVIHLPSATKSFFDYFVGSKGEWEHWSMYVSAYVYPKDRTPEFSSIIVPNMDSTRTTFLVKTLNKQDKPVLLIGEQGTAKSVTIHNYLKTLSPGRHMHKCINFSAATTPTALQQAFENYVEKRIGNTYGPPGSRKLVLFVDDLSMPAIDENGDQITNELLRQTIEDNGFYNLRRPGDFMNIVDVQIVAAMIQPGGGRNDIPQRLKRHFSLFNCTMPSAESIDRLFRIIATGYFRRTLFNESVCQIIPRLVKSTRRLQEMTKQHMSPTPIKFHYVFNLRDLSRIWEGILQVHPSQCQDVVALLKLWRHECNRVLSDRFINNSDMEWFDSTMDQILNTELGTSLEITSSSEYFVDFMSNHNLYSPRTIDTIVEKLKEYVQMYANFNPQFDMIVFSDCAKHVARMSRILHINRGSALLIGIEGSGKQHVAKLASFIAGYDFFQIELTNTYNSDSFAEDLKNLYRIAGLHNTGVTFFFSENDTKDESFLEYFNNMLGTGEVPSLFTFTERECIIDDFVKITKKERLMKGQELAEDQLGDQQIYDTFLSRVRNNLHIVLAFSPIGDTLRRRILKFPKLFSGCTVDWYNRWPREGLIDVATTFLKSYDVHKIKPGLETFMSEAFEDMYGFSQDYLAKFRRHTRFTPQTFLTSLKEYKRLHKAKYHELNDSLVRVNSGLQKLNESTVALDLLSKELEIKERELLKANLRADYVLKVMTSSAKEAERVKITVQHVKDKAQSIVDAIVTEKSGAEEKLVAAQPSIDAAENALRTIKPIHIATVKKLPKPPHLIMRIMDCTLLLFQKKIDPVTMDPEKPCPKPSWTESLKMISNTGFLASLVNFPRDQINDEIVELMSPYMDMKDYNFAHAKKVCGDVAGLLSWTVAMAGFYAMNKEVLPLKSNLLVLQQKFISAELELNECQKKLEETEKQLASAKQQYADADKEKQVLQHEAEVCKQKSQTSSMLIEGLYGERERWTELSQKFHIMIQNLVGDTALATTFITYAGPFNRVFRTLLHSHWMEKICRFEIDHTENINTEGFFIDMCKAIEWHVQGLPNDDHSIQNAVIATKSYKYPLIIDPQGQAKSWIKKMESTRDIQISSVTHRYLKNHLEESLAFGRPLLVENVSEEIDSIFSRVLQKQFVDCGLVKKVQIEDKYCDVMPGFYLYLTTTLPNPNFDPKVCASTSIVDFTVTQKGLEEQLLARLMKTEKRDLEMTKVALMENVARNKRKIKQLEDDLLLRLTSTEGSLIEDETLALVLQKTRTTATDIGEKLNKSEITTANINKAREQFRPVAERGSLLYFLICEMGAVNVMYQTSIYQFLQLFDRSLSQSRKTPITHQRVINISEYMTFAAFRYTCRGLYEVDKFVFMFLLAVKLDMTRSMISKEDLDIMIYGGASLNVNKVATKPCVCRWIEDEAWLNLTMLSSTRRFSGILEAIEKHDKLWKDWVSKPTPETEVIPNEFDYLNDFSKLLLIRCLCPERCLAQARIYVSSCLGERYAEPVTLDLMDTWKESDKNTPLLCLLSTGSDPTSQIETLSKRLNVECKTVSMGQGQETHARALIKSHMLNGGWVLLQNCHLGLSFMDELYDLISEEESIHNSFRVWMTTHEHVQFSRNLLQCSIKFTNEHPYKMREGLKRAVANIGDDLLQFSDLPSWKPLLYAVSFLHSAVQKRCTFGTLGWSIPYEFSNADWTTTVMFLKNHLDDIEPRRSVSWETIRYMIGHIHFGGKMKDDFDKRILLTYVDIWFSDQLLKEGFKFCLDYDLPSNIASRATLEQYIDTLPSYENPQVVGLHENADIFCNRMLTKQVLNTILSIQPKYETGFHDVKEGTVYAHIKEMMQKMPNEFVEFDVKERLRIKGILQPLNIFLKQEITCMQKLISEVKATLTDLQMAINGNIVMDPNLRDAFDNLCNASVPNNWKKISWDSSSIGFWMADLIERYNQLFKWLFHDRPTIFWPSGFFNPQAFLTTIRQEAIRANKGWELDSVKLHNEVLKVFKEDIKAPPTGGVYAYGLYLEGAAWDKKYSRLIECQAKVTTVKLPVVHFIAINKSISSDHSIYFCPLYKTPKRTDIAFVTCLALKTIPDPRMWVLRGVAALCNTT